MTPEEFNAQLQWALQYAENYDGRATVSQEFLQEVNAIKDKIRKDEGYSPAKEDAISDPVIISVAVEIEEVYRRATAFESTWIGLIGIRAIRNEFYALTAERDALRKELERCEEVRDLAIRDADRF